MSATGRARWFLAGLLVGLLGISAAGAVVAAKVDTNGTLVGYIVQKDGTEICRDPSVWNEFRDGFSYIVCD